MLFYLLKWLGRHELIQGFQIASIHTLRVCEHCFCNILWDPKSYIFRTLL